MMAVELPMFLAGRFMDVALDALVALDDTWPFREPVDPEDVPDYYDVIKVGPPDQAYLSELSWICK